ncbi:MAG: hypothetical protein PF638_02810 [Candidatus Delongbacteria bacterium]|jgi:hypothetical protein|nr:hypothetical protein [Candidatus Delongbacteria bacterium]
MNWIVFLGIFIIAIGTVVMTIGTSMQNKKEKKDISNEIKDVFEKIEKIQENEESIDKKNSLSKIENEFSEWSKNFVNNREERIVKYQQRALSKSEKEVELTKKYSPFYQELLDSFTNIIIAYNQNSGDSIEFKTDILSKNLYQKGYSGVIAFSKKIIWKIECKGVDPFGNDPTFTITPEDVENVNLINPRKFIIVPMEDKVLIVDDSNNYFKDVGLDKKTYNLSNYKQDAKQIVKELFEFQLHKLGK